MTTQVAVPFDGSAPSRLAIAYAFEQFPDAEVTVFQVIKPFPDHTKAGGHTGRKHARVFEDRRRLLADAVADRADRPGGVQTVLLYGRPRDEVPRYIIAKGFDEVVMGSRGLSGTVNRFFGSVSRAVIRRTPVPVTILRADLAEDDLIRPPRQRGVLVPFDESPRARDALSYALTRFPDADVTALSVVTTEAEANRIVTWGDGDETTDWAAPKTDGGRVLESAQRIADRHERPLSIATDSGDSGADLATWVRDSDIDHVVVGRSPVGRLRSMLKGPLAETAVSRVSVPVTVVP